MLDLVKVAIEAEADAFAANLAKKAAFKAWRDAVAKIIDAKHARDNAAAVYDTACEADYVAREAFNAADKKAANATADAAIAAGAVGCDRCAEKMWASE